MKVCFPLTIITFVLATTASATPISSRVLRPADDVPGTVTAADTSTSGNAAATTTTTAASGADSGTFATGAAATVNANLKMKPYPDDAYHMPSVRAIHARVQSDAPILVDGSLVSSFGDGELEAGYLAALDTVNTASVEGALMYVQAEGINYKSRSDEDRCWRKNGMQYIVFYEVLIAQTNETIAQFQDDWETLEYGPMIPMDSGRCTPLTGDGSSIEDFPVECMQFSGEDGQPNIGPFVGGGDKSDDVRAPYPNTYWFSFPNTCPLSGWGDKSDECRASTRAGLCEFGYAPNGVDCTFAYDILGYIAIDDIVGITQIVKDNTTQEMYANFTEWCEASDDHVEFIADPETGEFVEGLPFWEDPLDSEVNAERAGTVVAKYLELLGEGGGSTQITDELVASFHTLPTPEELEAVNPPCFKTVQSCGKAPGCKRVGYSQICTPCKEGEECPLTDGAFVFPTLTKAKTSLSENETSTNKTLLDNAGESSEEEASADGSASASGSTEVGDNGAAAASVSLVSVVSAALVMSAAMW